MIGNTYNWNSWSRFTNKHSEDLTIYISLNYGIIRKTYIEIL